MEEVKMLSKRWFPLTVLLTIPLLTGCWYAAAAGAGAYGGYKAKEEGYTLQNPVKKEGAKKSSKTTEKTKSSEKEQGK